ncbi:MAG: hypothetical protein M1321_00425 [Candidatus Marsarchaeota archaeon]|nr:hypothetical protein [Candidatus Marsarchaeota archaeon]
MDDDSADFVFERVLTNVSDISTPGHIISTFPSPRHSIVYERIIFLPEDFFVELEGAVIEHDRRHGRERLYEVGKQFGYRFTSLFDPDTKDVGKSIYTVFRYLETLYAEKVEIRSIDLAKKTIHIYAKNLVVTDRNDMGYVLPIGGLGGIWSYLFNDYTMECSHRKLSDTEVEIVMGPPEELRSLGLEVMTSLNAPESLDWDSYKIHNAAGHDAHGEYLSMERFMSSGVIAYERGDMEIKKARLVSIELSFLFSIEDRFSDDEVFSSSYNVFSKLAESVGEHGDPYRFLAKFFTALGFGRVMTIGRGDRMIFNFSGYPWASEKQEESGFGFVRGAIVGFLDGSTGAKNGVGPVSHSMLDNSFMLTIEVYKE